MTPSKCRQCHEGIGVPQGPLPATLADFWRMVWEQGSGVLIMLTRTTEVVVKCAPYFPEGVGDSIVYGASSARIGLSRR